MTFGIFHRVFIVFLTDPTAVHSPAEERKLVNNPRDLDSEISGIAQVHPGDLHSARK